jgi:cytochrome c oxidase assembly protein subunit 15
VSTVSTAPVAAAGRWGRAREALTSLTGFRTLALVALGALWVIVPSGALVRLTASGLGCPDVPPLCDGSVVPAAVSHHVVIEFSNRVLSGAVMLVCVATLAVALLLPDRPRAIRAWAIVIAAVSVAQVPLGAVTVATDLHPLAVGSHFMLSMAALAAGTLLVLRATDRAAGRTRAWDLRKGPLAGVVAIAAAALLVTGVLVTASGPHSGDRGVADRFWRIDHAAYVHVRAAVVFVVLAAVLAVWVMREGGGSRLTRWLGLVTLVLTVAQIVVGEYQYRHGLPWEVVTLHVSLAAALWAAVVATAWSIARPAVGGAGADPLRPGG